MPTPSFERLPEAKKTRIFHGICRELLDSDVQTLTVSRVAKASGISRSVLYHYFSSKADMIFYTADEIEARLKRQFIVCLYRADGKLGIGADAFLNWLFGEEGNELCRLWMLLRSGKFGNEIADRTQLLFFRQNSWELFLKYYRAGLHAAYGQVSEEALSHAVELILMITEKSVFYFMAGWEPRDAIQAAAGTQYQILEKGIVKEHSAE